MPALAKAVLLLPLLAILVSGCTMDISYPSESKSFGVQMQRNSSAPGQSLREINDADLRPGDLLFSSNISLTSIGIRLFSTSAVSHVALYIGEGEVAEAVGSGVQIVSLEKAKQHSDKIFALRLADLSLENAEKIRTFALQKAGSKYNYKGIIKMAPFMLTKQLCSLNPFSREFRQQCVNGLAKAQLSTPTGEASRFFCSEFVTAAYEQAGHPLAIAAASWVSPADLLHMREGDVATLRGNQPLVYVGHLKPGIYLKARKLVTRG